MNEETPSPSSSASPALGLAIASLVLGILSLVVSFLVVGAVAALLGIALGWAHLARRPTGRGMAAWGVALSVIGLLAAGGFAALYYTSVQKMIESRSEGGGDSTFAAWHGVPAPDIEVTKLDGSALKLSDLKGRRVVLDFWATWCPPCRMEIPHFVELARETPEDELLIVGISNEDRATLQAFAEKNNMNYPVAIAADEALPEPYNLITGIPTTFFIDRNGVFQHIVVGYHDYDALKSMALGDDVAGDPAALPVE